MKVYITVHCEDFEVLYAGTDRTKAELVKNASLWDAAVIETEVEGSIHFHSIVYNGILDSAVNKASTDYDKAEKDYWRQMAVDMGEEYDENEVRGWGSDFNERYSEYAFSTDENVTIFGEINLADVD